MMPKLTEYERKKESETYMTFAGLLALCMC